MMRLTIMLMLCFINVKAQVNCYIYDESSSMRKACELSYEAIKYKQGSRKSQEIFDTSIRTNPNFEWSYKEKSVPFFKRGFLLEGLKLLNKAVELEPKQNLSYRAYWYFQYKNYKMCIKDLERFYALPKPYMKELTPGGDNDMRILLAMSYAKLGNFRKAIKETINCISYYEKEEFHTNHHILGLFYLKNKEDKKALETFKIQLEINKKLPDTHYYMGLIYQKMNFKNKAKDCFEKAKELFDDNTRLKNLYRCYPIYKYDVELSLKGINQSI